MGVEAFQSDEVRALNLEIHSPCGPPFAAVTMLKSCVLSFMSGDRGALNAEGDL